MNKDTYYTLSRRRGYLYRRIAVAMMAFLPLWAAFVLAAFLPLWVSALAIAVIWLPTIALISALLSAAESELN